MPIVWPVTISEAPLWDGYRETAPNTMLRSEMDVGPAKTRQRYTAAPRYLDFVKILTTSQLADLDDFYVTDTAGGALDFELTHPRTAATVDVRFMGPPVYEPAGANAWRVSFQLEILP